MRRSALFDAPPVPAMLWNFLPNWAHGAVRKIIRAAVEMTALGVVR